jgi:hypothetical protein
VQSPLAAHHELEVLDRVGQVDLPPVDPGPLEIAVEQAPRRPDEWPPDKILLVAWLLADDHQFGLLRPFPHYRLVLEQADRAAPAGVDRFVDPGESRGPLLEFHRAVLAPFTLPTRGIENR